MSQTKVLEKIKHNLCPVTNGRVYDSIVTLISFTHHFRSVSIVRYKQKQNIPYFILWLVPGNRSKFNSKHFVCIKIYYAVDRQESLCLHIQLKRSWSFIKWRNNSKAHAQIFVPSPDIICIKQYVSVTMFLIILNVQFLT